MWVLETGGSPAVTFLIVVVLHSGLQMLGFKAHCLKKKSNILQISEQKYVLHYLVYLQGVVLCVAAYNIL
jgi:hypothetical protein